MGNDLLLCLTASDATDFVEKAIIAGRHCSNTASIHHPCCRENVRYLIQQQSGKLFEDDSIASEWDAFLKRL